jgi:hypothetical protein
MEVPWMVRFYAVIALNLTEILPVLRYLQVEILVQLQFFVSLAHLAG